MKPDGKRRITSTERTHFLFALKNAAPLPKTGLRGEMQINIGCRNSDEENLDPCSCCSFTYSFWQIPGASHDLTTAAKAVEKVLELLTTQVKIEYGSTDQYPDVTTVVLVGGPIGDDETLEEHYASCLNLIHHVIRSLCIVTESHRPAVIPRNIWPLGFTLESKNWNISDSPLVEYEVTSINQDPHFPYHPGAPATEEQIGQAAHFVIGLSLSDPVALLKDVHATAKSDIEVRADYAGGLLNCAIAAELLIKHVSWLIIWEDAGKALGQGGKTLPDDPKWMSTDIKPGQYIGGVLAPKLKGSWDSSNNTSPVGGWRRNVAQRRNKLMHLGEYPTKNEAEIALTSLVKLQQHISIIVTKNRRKYPLTYSLLSGMQHRKIPPRGVIIQTYQRWLIEKLQPTMQDE